MKKSAQLATSVIVPLPKISTSEVTRDRPGICATSRRGMTDLEFDRKRANRFLRFLRKVSPRNGRTHDCKQMRRSRLKKVFPVKISKMRERQSFFRVKSILLVKVATRVARVFNVAKCANRIFLWNADQSGSTLESFDPLYNSIVLCTFRQKRGSSARRDYDNARAPPFGILQYSARRTSFSRHSKGGREREHTMSPENAAS